LEKDGVKLYQSEQLFYFSKLPHSLFDKSTEICLFTKDISVKYPEKTVELYERRFRKLNLPIKV